MALWNARACGAAAFPVPVGHEKRVLAGAEAWLNQLLDDGELSRWTTGDGRPAGPRIYVWQAAGPGGLPLALAARGVTPVREDLRPPAAAHQPGQRRKPEPVGVIPPQPTAELTA